MKLEDIELGDKLFCNRLHQPVIVTKLFGSTPRIEVKPQKGGKRWVEACELRPLTLNDTTPEEWDRVSTGTYDINPFDEMQDEATRKAVEGINKGTQEVLTPQEYVDKIDEAHEALASQVGGSHYKDQKIQPFEYCYATYGLHGLKASVHTKVNKYLTRDKGSELEDVRKAIHCLQILEQKMVEENKDD